MIRTLTAQDVAAYRALWLHALHAEPAAFLLTPVEAVATPESALVAKLSGGEVIGAFEANSLFGFVALRRGGPERLRHMADLGPLYVAPEARGRGVARALLQAAEQTARAWGVLQIELCVEEQNATAIGLYRSFGFDQIGRRPRSVIVDGKARNDLLLLKTLDA